jgi:hypothetical protein
LSFGVELTVSKSAYWGLRLKLSPSFQSKYAVPEHHPRVRWGFFSSFEHHGLKIEDEKVVQGENVMFLSIIKGKAIVASGLLGVI